MFVWAYMRISGVIVVSLDIHSGLFDCCTSELLIGLSVQDSENLLGASCSVWPREDR
jgi:hypothetical protein